MKRVPSVKLLHHRSPPQQPGPPRAAEPAAGMFFLQGPCLFSVFTSGQEGHSLEASLFTATCRLGGEVWAAGLAWDFLQTLLTSWGSYHQPEVPGPLLLRGLLCPARAWGRLELQGPPLGIPGFLPSLLMLAQNSQELCPLQNPCFGAPRLEMQCLPSDSE